MLKQKEVEIKEKKLAMDATAEADRIELELARIEAQINEFKVKYGKDHNFSIDYKLAGGICIPSDDKNIEGLFVQVDSLSSKLELDHDQHQALINIH